MRRKEKEEFDLETRRRIALGSLEEAVTGRIIHPRIVVGTSHASLKVDGLAGYLLRSQFAGMGHPARRRSLHRALLSPGLKVLRFCDGARVLDPLDHLSHRHEVYIIVALQDLIDPVQESVQELGIILQPGGVEVEAKGRAVLLVVSIEVVVEEVIKLIAGQDVATRVHHSAAGQILIVLRILAPIQLIHHHLPHSVRSANIWTYLETTVVAYPRTLYNWD